MVTSITQVSPDCHPSITKVDREKSWLPGKIEIFFSLLCIVGRIREVAALNNTSEQYNDVQYTLERLSPIRGVDDNGAFHGMIRLQWGQLVLMRCWTLSNFPKRDSSEMY